MRSIIGLLLAGMVVLATWDHSILVDNNPFVRDVEIVETVEAERSLSEILSLLNWDDEPIRITVDKSDRQMRILVKDSLVKTFPVALGLSPTGDKQMQGDKKTPEGIFTIRGKYPHKDWHKFIWVDYPNEESWRRFKERKAAGEIPSDAKIGGEIGIHGLPGGVKGWVLDGSDWTFGCIAMENNDIDELYPYVLESKTTIHIVP